MVCLVRVLAVVLVRVQVRVRVQVLQAHFAPVSLQSDGRTWRSRKYCRILVQLVKDSFLG